MTVALFLLTIFFSALVQSSCGFGFGIFAMMFLPRFMPSYALSIALAGILSVSTTTANVLRYRKDVSPRLLLIPFAAYALVSTASILCLKGLGDALVKRMLGGALLAGSLFFLCTGGRLSVKPTVRNGLTAGVVSGLLGGLFSMPGPPAAVYFLGATAEKRTYFATIQAYFFLSNAYVTIVRALNGMVPPEALPYAVLGTFATALGAFAGNRVFGKLSGKGLRTIVYALMAINGLITIFG